MCRENIPTQIFQLTQIFPLTQNVSETEIEKYEQQEEEMMMKTAKKYEMEKVRNITTREIGDWKCRDFFRNYFFIFFQNIDSIEIKKEKL